MRLGFLQLRPRFGAVAENVGRAAVMLKRARDATIVLPELFPTGYLFGNRGEVKKLAEAVPGGFTCRVLRDLAARNRLNLVFGIAERGQGRFYNSAVLVTASGRTLVYRKTHLFDREKLFFSPGEGLFPPARVGAARLGILICFDWIFPEVSRVLALRGAQILCHPSNLVLPWGQEAMRTRCLENRVFAVTANRVGTERRAGMSLTFTGRSQIVGPRGEILFRAAEKTEMLKIVEVDLREARTKRVTRRNDLFRDRRPRLYQALV